MAAKRKSASPTPGATSSGDLRAATQRAEEAEARANRMAERLADLEEEEGVAEADAHQPTYDPATHVLLSREDHSVLLRAKAEGDARAQDMLTAMAKGSEGVATVLMTLMEANKKSFETSMEANGRQREADLKFGNEMRDQVARLQGDVAMRDRQIADMQRQSEEAALERQRLAADVAQVRAANDRLSMELDSKERMRALELGELRKAAAPTLDIVGKLAQAYAMKEFGMALPGLPPAPGGGTGAPAPSPPPGAGPHGPSYTISCADVESFREVLRAVLDASGPETLGCTRAFLCSYFLAEFGAPPPPADLGHRFRRVVLEEVGQDHVKALLHACGAAYAPGAAAPPASAASSAPN